MDNSLFLFCGKKSSTWKQGDSSPCRGKVEIFFAPTSLNHDFLQKFEMEYHEKYTFEWMDYITPSGLTLHLRQLSIIITPLWGYSKSRGDLYFILLLMAKKCFQKIFMGELQRKISEKNLCIKIPKG